MRGDAQGRLDRGPWTQLADHMPKITVLAALLAAGYAYHETSRAERHVAGTVQSADWRLNCDTGEHYPYIRVKLDSGASVRVGNVAPALPAVGDHITLRERMLLFDYMTIYEWDGPDGVLPAIAHGSRQNQ